MVVEVVIPSENSVVSSGLCRIVGCVEAEALIIGSPGVLTAAIAVAVATSSYLAAVYLAADARRRTDPDLARIYRLRGLRTGAVAGVLAVAALAVVRQDAPGLWNGLVSTGGLVAVGISAAGGLVTLALVWRRRFGLARASAALAVVAIVAGWAVAQQPTFLPGLTVGQAAAGHRTLLAVIIGMAVGAAVVIPSLILLFGLLLRGRLDTGLRGTEPARRVRISASRPRPVVSSALAVIFLVAGVGRTVFAEPAWALAVGVVCLCACAVSTFALATTAPPTDP
ncbi:cytochrome d ubiquinol oxidase subunit II [Saccharopolyspora sp. 5N708]|uniref:cytochrome d ubiquinol oxidase subunit II n=1 Tax=Saccharopolyspora sp. 5N708 TaxID=3457424 RepID=UPI003FD51AF2